jgi:hypothetical protein
MSETSLKKPKVGVMSENTIAEVTATETAAVKNKKN